MKKVGGANKADGMLQVDLREDEDEDGDSDEDGESDEYLDVLDVLDGRGKIDDEDDVADGIHNGSKESSKPVYKPHSTPAQTKEDEEDSDEEEEEEDSIISASDDEDEVNDDAFQNLRSLVSTFEKGAKRKADEEVEAINKTERKKKRVLFQERNEAGVEGEFGAKSSGNFPSFILCCAA